MLLKIFVKRKAHGELCTTEFDFCETLHEASQISKAEISENLKTEGFRFVMTGKDGTIWDAYCATNTHGFEVLNDTGVCVDKFVSAVRESDMPEKAQFTETNLVKFGNYLFSAERAGSTRNPEVEKSVTDADLKNFYEAHL